MALKYGGKTISDYSAMRGPCPEGFHVPMIEEWRGLIGTLATVLSTGPDGTAMKTYLKMPLAGFRNFPGGGEDSQGSIGNYWTSTKRLGVSVWCIAFDASSTPINLQNYSSSRTYGYSIRGFKDSPIIPDNSWTILYDGSSVATGAGVFHNATLGLISVSGDGITWHTIQDKNLGATIAYTDGATLSEANCGKYYQRGNNYGFPRTGAMTMSSIKIDASGYGPGNYYSSDTFITGSGDWSSVRNDNLRGGVTGVKQNPVDIVERYYGGKLIDDYSAMRGPCPIGYHIATLSEWQSLMWTGSHLGAWNINGRGDDVKLYLRIPFAGIRFPQNGGTTYNGTNWQGYSANLWTSIGPSTSDDTARSFQITASSVRLDAISVRSAGYSVRPFKDVPVAPDSSWTTLYDGSSVVIGAGIFHNSTLGLISISGDGTTWTTIADKNLGATITYSNGDTLSQANCGNFYQWGNCYGFPFSGNVTTSGTQVDASTYGPRNYYTSSTFITRNSGSSDWSSVKNDNLWGGVTGIQQRIAEVKEVYYNTTKIWPLSGTVSGSIDFRNVTKADLTAQGWLTSGEPWVALDSTNGLYCSATSNDKYAGLYMPMDFTNAKKATLTWEFRQDRRSWAWGPRFGITQTNNVDKNSFVAFVNFCNENSYQQQELSYINNSGSATHLANQQISLTGGNYTIKLEINFETGEVVKTVTGATPYTQTGTLTSELIDTIKQFGYIAQRVGWGMPTASYCYTMAYEIEY